MGIWGFYRVVSVPVLPSRSHALRGNAYESSPVFHSRYFAESSVGIPTHSVGTRSDHEQADGNNSTGIALVPADLHSEVPSLLKIMCTVFSLIAALIPVVPNCAS